MAKKLSGKTDTEPIKEATKQDTKPSKEDPRMDDLKRREKWLDVYGKVSEVREKREKAQRDALEQDLDIRIMRKDLELKTKPKLFDLFMATQLTIIDESLTQIGSEPKFKNLFEGEDMDKLKETILDKLLERKK